MINKPSEDDLKYIREHFSTSEKIFKQYINMRNSINDIYKLKYEVKDDLANSKEFELGFNAGVKVMLSLFLEI